MNTPLKRKGLRVLIIVIALFSTACATSPRINSGADLSRWRSADQKEQGGLWYGQQACRADHVQSQDILIGTEKTAANKYRILLIKKRTVGNTSRYESLEFTQTEDAPGTVTVRFPKRKRAPQTKYIRLTGLNTPNDLQAIAVDSIPFNAESYIKRCKMNKLQRVVSGSEGPLLENWRVLSASEYDRRRLVIGNRADLVGSWSGTAVCRGGAKPVSLDLNLDPDVGWRASFTMERNTTLYRMLPQPHFTDADAYRFEALGQPETTRLTSLSGRRIKALGDHATWITADIAGCRDSLLYRHRQLAQLSGQYAQADSLNSFCKVVRDEWTGPVSAMLQEAEAARRGASNGLPAGYRPINTARRLINDSSRFRNVFGLAVDAIDPATYKSLTYQLASCAVLGAQPYRDDIKTGLFKAGSTRHFDPERRQYPLYLPQAALAAAQRNYRQTSVAQLQQQLLNTQTVAALESALGRLARDFERVAPKQLSSLQSAVEAHRNALVVADLAARRAEISRNGPPQIDVRLLQAALHRLLQNASRISDRVVSAFSGLPQGFAYSCGDGIYCTALGGIVKYRYYVAKIERCNYSGKFNAACRFRMGLDVESTLSASSALGNQMLGGLGAAAIGTVVESTLRFDDLDWDIVNGVKPVSK